MKKMKRSKMASLKQIGFPVLAVKHAANVWLLVACRIAACALVMQCLSPAWAGDALPVKTPGNQTAPAPNPAYLPKGRQMERYKAFARAAKMPTILISDQTTIEVGGVVKTDLKRLARLSSREKEALAGQFDVPAGVIARIMERANTNSSPAAAQIARDIRTAVIDYRFLAGEFGRYHPPAAGEQVKTDALAALKSGDISKAWELYDGLNRPGPAGKLQVITQP